VSAWSDEIDAATKYTTARVVGSPRRFLVWITRCGVASPPHEYEADNAEQAKAMARAELERFETAMSQIFPSRP
jgi:hypothetical protein